MKQSQETRRSLVLLLEPHGLLAPRCPPPAQRSRSGSVHQIEQGVLGSPGGE